MRQADCHAVFAANASFAGCFYFHASQNVMFRELSALICVLPLKSLSVLVKIAKGFV